MKKLVTLLLALVLGTACFSMTACGGNGIKVNPDKEHYVVGISQLVQHPALDSATQGFKDALTAELQKENRTVEFDEQNASNDSTTCTTIANGFVAKDVDLIMANATPALQAAANATTSIPILGTSVTEYGVALGIENFSGTVGGNISGTSDLAPLTTQAQMMIDLFGLTSGSKVAILYCSAEANSEYQYSVVKDYLQGKGITADKKTFVDSNDISSVCNGIVGGNYNAVYTPTDNTVAANTEVIDSILRPARIPVFAGEEGICKGCGVATLSISYYNLGYKTGEMAAKVLLGKEDITKLAIDYDANPVKKYRPAVATELGITIPSDYTAIEE